MSQTKPTSNQVQELWEKGVASFLNEDDRASILNFETLLPLLDKDNPKYSSSVFYIAHSYRVLLKTEGITKTEADRMIECYETYLGFPTTVFNIDTNKEVADFLARKKKTRPVKIEHKWKDKTD